MLKRKKIRRKIFRNIFPEFSSLKFFGKKQILPETKQIIDYWYGKKNTIKSRPETKTYSDTVEYLNHRIGNFKTERGKRRFVTAAINAISKYDIILEEGGIKRISIKTFFIPPNRMYSKRPTIFQLIERNKIEQHLKQEGTLKQRRYVADKLSFHYCKHVLKRKDNIGNKQKRMFGIAARRILSYTYKNSDLDFLSDENKLDNFIRLLITAIKWNYKKDFFHIGCLASEYTFNEILPKYINLKIKSR